VTGSLGAGRRLQGSEAGLGEKRLLREPKLSRGHPVLPLLPTLRAKAQPSTGCRASRSWIHGLPAIRPRSVAGDSSFLSRAAPFRLCLPVAPADAAADEQTRRPGSTVGPLCRPLGGTDTAALDQDSSKARAALAISREGPASSRRLLPLAA